jgi:hypothetical protein
MLTPQGIQEQGEGFLLCLDLQREREMKGELERRSVHDLEEEVDDIVHPLTVAHRVDDADCSQHPVHRSS